MKKLIKVGKNYYTKLQDACSDNGGVYNTVKAKEFPFDEKGKTYEKVDVQGVVWLADSSRQFIVNGEQIKTKTK